MSTRASGKKRRRHDLYETPSWLVSDALAQHVQIAGLKIMEPATGNGKLMQALEAAGATVHPSDVKRHPRFPHRLVNQPHWQKINFVEDEPPTESDMAYCDALVFNPPYGVQGKLACQFIARGIQYLRAGPPATLARRRWMAVLLPVDFDSASTRAELFGFCPEFFATIKLLRRILWFKPKKNASGPSQNHAWFIWQQSVAHLFDEQTPPAWRHPAVMYAPPVVRGQTYLPDTAPERAAPDLFDVANRFKVSGALQ